MEWHLRKIQARQIERETSALPKVLVPTVGWIKTIRKTLGMNTRQLGERCGITSERIIRIEADEVSKRITMATLDKMAKAMNCKLVYAFVPNNGLVEFIEQTAGNKAKNSLTRISHHMKLEDQKTSDTAINEQIEALKDEMLRNNLKNIWDK